VNTLLENVTGMNVMTDQVIALDLLIAAKTGIKDCAVAITETATPEVRAVLRKQLEDGISFHEQLSKYMIEKGWYKAYDAKEHVQMVIENANTALNASQR